MLVSHSSAADCWLSSPQRGEDDILPEEKEKSFEQAEDDDGRQEQARRALAVVTVRAKPKQHRTRPDW